MRATPDRHSSLACDRRVVKDGGPARPHHAPSSQGNAAAATPASAENHAEPRPHLRPSRCWAAARLELVCAPRDRYSSLACDRRVVADGGAASPHHQPSCQPAEGARAPALAENNAEARRHMRPSPARPRCACCSGASLAIATARSHVTGASLRMAGLRARTMRQALKAMQLLQRPRVQRTESSPALMEVIRREAVAARARNSGSAQLARM